MRRLVSWPLIGLCAVLVAQAVIGGLVARGVITDATVWLHFSLGAARAGLCAVANFAVAALAAAFRRNLVRSVAGWPSRTVA